MSCKGIASLLKPACTHLVGLLVYAQSFSQKEMMFGQMLEARNQKEMRIVKMTIAETKKKLESLK